jgi:hypothetical protein
MLTHSDITSILDDLQHVADARQSGADVHKLYEIYFNEHVRQHGRYDYLENREYFRSMLQRQDYALCRVNKTLEVAAH